MKEVLNIVLFVITGSIGLYFITMCIIGFIGWFKDLFKKDETSSDICDNYVDELMFIGPMTYKEKKLKLLKEQNELLKEQNNILKLKGDLK